MNYGDLRGCYPILRQIIVIIIIIIIIIIIVSRFFVHFFTVVLWVVGHRFLGRRFLDTQKPPSFTFYGRRELKCEVTISYFELR